MYKWLVMAGAVMDAQWLLLDKLTLENGHVTKFSFIKKNCEKFKITSDFKSEEISYNLIAETENTNNRIKKTLSVNNDKSSESLELIYNHLWQHLCLVLWNNLFHNFCHLIIAYLFDF